MIYLGLIGVPITFGAIALAKPLILKIYTAEYEPSILTLQILAVGLAFLFLNFPLGSLLNACDRQRRNTIHIGVVMVINIILNVTLIPKYSYEGAAVASSLSTFLMFLLQLYVARQIIPFSGRYLTGQYLRIILAGLVMYLALIYLLPAVHLLLLVPLGAVLYLFVLYLLKGFDQEDFLLLYRSFFKKEQ